MADYWRLNSQFIHTTIVAIAVGLLTACASTGSEVGLNRTTSSNLTSVPKGKLALHGAAVVYKNGQQVFSHYDGVANASWDLPIKEGVRFRIGSISKPMTAAVILSLADEQKLSLDDTVQQWLAEYNIKGASEVKLRHLLNHSSGLYHYPDSKKFEEIRANVSKADQLVSLFSNRSLGFVPGEQWSYSNANYVLLGLVAEKASGLSYAALIQRYIAKPAKLSATAHEGRNEIVPQLATPYYISPEGDYSALPFVAPLARYAAGSVYSTATDMAKWMQHLLDAQKAGDELYTKLTTATISLPDGVAEQAGVPPEYANGWFVGERNIEGCKLYIIEHGGSILGYHARLRYLPGDNLIVSVAANTTDDIQEAVDQLTLDNFDAKKCSD
ncbi:MAG: hypothetical protein DHS20C05_24400 [Hyphococcus sp.]|nr:MAG: hypothetical protein DHS20C05_24400 [Marinicaulis sp.]